MGQIKCGVEECSYWKDMECQAKAIEVASSGDDPRVSTSEGTMCQTFQYKDYGKIRQ